MSKSLKSIIFPFWSDGNAGEELTGMMTIHSSFNCQISNGGCIVWMYIIGDSCRDLCILQKTYEEPWINHEVNQWALYNSFTAIKATAVTINKVVCLNEALGHKKLDYSVYFCHKILLRMGGVWYVRHKESCLGFRLYSSHNLPWKVVVGSILVNAKGADQITNVCMISKLIKASIRAIQSLGINIC